MKKISFMVVMTIATIALTSCGNARPPKANLKTDVDTLSYALGVGLGEELKNYLPHREPMLLVQRGSQRR